MKPLCRKQFLFISHTKLMLRPNKAEMGLYQFSFSSTCGEFSTPCWGSCDKWQSCRFNSSEVSNTCHNSFSLQLSKCWLLRRETKCAIKAHLSLYSCVNPAMLNTMRSHRAPSRRDESREASIHREGQRSTRAVNSIWKSKHKSHHGPLFDSWHLKV